MENYLEAGSSSQGVSYTMQQRFDDFQKDDKQVKISTLEAQSDIEIDNEIDLKTIFPSSMHPLTILEDISYKLRVYSPRYKFNQAGGNSGEITCTLNFLNKSWSSHPALTTILGAKEDVARMAFNDIMENMEPNLRERLVKSLKVQKNKYMNTRPQKKRLQKNHLKEQKKATSKESIQPKDQNQNQRSKKKFIGNKPRSFSWLNHQASIGRQNPNINLKCPCHMLKEFCKFQNLAEPVYDTQKVFDSFIGKVSIGDFHQEADCVARIFSVK
ncbi:18716_t:CDS:2 [Funneliformis geosporum]|uniref:18716_t:CDS:1 n=1 Tax=Funneliformis geosporum TaxID=1117311 RepID=A0A9W4SJR4_9GLOM|nr:18716_t:CDS:2 [Funneliformis geosporum]